uniref:Ribosomal protein S10 n=1 Tax=Ulva sp. TM637 TaxID=2496872 RepID=A0A7R6NFD0_9CHLO|nr:ribosomal protein S10 [Ulva sp. TM637]AZP40102.1 ribosomal protein S10 [Ulva sp. TM637]
MLIKKQHNKNIIFLGKLNKVKQQCCFKTQTLNKSLCFENSTVITQRKKLTITLRSYTVCQVKDISSSIAAIEKLINYLNYLCAKQLRAYFELKIQPISDKTGTIKECAPIILGFFTSSCTSLLNCQNAILSRYQKQQGLLHHKMINSNNSDSLKKVPASQLTNNLKQCSSFAETLDYSSYLGRCFFKLSKKFSSLNAKKLVQRRNSKKLITLIRSPFVFKKTREQFSSQKLSSHIVITFANSAQKHFIIQNLRLLKLPTELKVVSHN